MSLSSGYSAGPPLSPFNRNDWRGAALSAAVPTLLVAIGNGLIALTGWSQSDAAYEQVSFSPPGWMVGAVWLAVYPMWGWARWHAYQMGRDGRQASWWVVALMAWGLLYPILAAPASTSISALMNAFSLGLAVATFIIVRGPSRTASWWIAPSILWLTFASILGVAAVGYA